MEKNEIYETMSAIQKCIRRGMEYHANFFASELEDFNPKMLWNRLQIIASEDVGPANPMMPVIIDTLERKYWELLRQGNGGCRLFLVNAVTILARSQKSRDADDLITIIEIQRNILHQKIAIPDFALDKHTVAGKKMGRGFEHFFDEGCKLENQGINDGKYGFKAKELIMQHGSGSPIKMEILKRFISQPTDANGLDKFT